MGVAAARNFAGASGFGPEYLVLETRVLPLDDTPYFIG